LSETYYEILYRYRKFGRDPRGERARDDRRLTTNPSLVAKERDVDFKEHIAKICEIVKGDVSAEVTALDTAGMWNRDAATQSRKNVVVKCPLT
jgi:transaldolase